MGAMNRRPKFLFVLFILFIQIPALARDNRIAEVSLTEEGKLYYNGYLDKTSNEKLFSLYEQANPKPKVLQVTSGGGDIVLGLDLGEWIFDKGLDVEVLKHCASSCANYVFPAGKRKILYPDSILFWHGGAHQKNMQSMSKRRGSKALDAFLAMRDREDRFFQKIGINGKITTYGQSRHFNMFWTGYWGRAGYDYSIEDMKKFGLDNIVEEGGIWDWRHYHREPPVKRVRVKEL